MKVFVLFANRSPLIKKFNGDIFSEIKNCLLFSTVENVLYCEKSP